MAVKPKLAMIPSGVGVGKLYSVLPSDGTGDFTSFDRNENTATRINKDGLIEMVDADVPRLNYPLIDGVVSGCPSLLLEPSRTNLVTYSEDFSQWTGTGINITANDTISPNGTLDADKVQSTDAFFGKYIQPTVSSGADYTASVFVKNANDNNSITFRLLLGTNDCRYIFNIEDLTVTAISGYTSGFVGSNVEDYGNGWVKCSLTVSSNGTSSVFAIYPKIIDNAETKSANLWGAQLEQSSFPTSYIPSLTGSQTTRSAETCNNAGDVNTFNDSEGVLMAEVNFENNDTNKGISISDGTSSNRVLFYLATNGNLYGYVFNGNGSIPIVNIIDTNFQINSTAKLAIKYKQNDFSFWVNGIEIGTETNGNTFSSGVLDQLSFTSYGTIANPFFGNTKQIQYFDTALTDTDLEELTSWRSFNEMAQDLLYTIL